MIYDQVLSWPLIIYLKLPDDEKKPFAFSRQGGETGEGIAIMPIDEKKTRYLTDGTN